MSIFDTIKGKIVTVQYGVANSGLLPFSSSSKPTTSNISPAHSQAAESYLSRCQKCWSEIHRNSENNALLAQEVDSLVTQTMEHLEHQNTALSRFVDELTAFHDLESDVGAVRDKMSLLSGLCCELEAMLVELEDTCDQLALCKNKRDHENQLISYQQRKHLQLEQSKVQLAHHHASKVQQYEQQLCATLRERQQVFEEAFVQQMQQYKTSGHIEGDTVKPAACVDLADIVVEDDPTLLDEFLAAAEPAAAAAAGMPAAESIASLDPYAAIAVVIEEVASVDGPTLVDNHISSDPGVPTIVIPSTGNINTEPEPTSQDVINS